MIKKIEEFKDRFNKALSMRDMRAVEVTAKTGISEATISQYRSGYAKPKADKLQILADCLDVNPTWLMGLDVPMANYDIAVSLDNGIDKIVIEDGSLTKEEQDLIRKFRADEKFRNIVQALNVYDSTNPTPISTPKVPKHKSYAYKYTPNTKKIAKPRKSKEDLA